MQNGLKNTAKAIGAIAKGTALWKQENCALTTCFQMEKLTKALPNKIQRS